MADSLVVHPFDPIYDPTSKILILGSVPSVLSRHNGFYYGNPQNRFWRVMARLFGQTLPASDAERRQLLLANHVALWDVIGTCRIQGSSDASITEPVPNDLNGLIQPLSIQRIYCNGRAAARFYEDYRKQHGTMPCVVLPSTSPANARYSLDDLIRSWQVILADL